ncbi:carboxymuconolactone decarboxylase family protein [Sphingomonas sp. ID1715]|uniref:carboxymuconolactone decarboxylase family protein n=1 Tax=Sphingomonas sp. ID1715 TaxID=1656898 RepID=UPI001487CEE3|nr:carboxymuconolactone decarboxylase family protein [Sphingomonas sp. ID1715]NNM76475.1 carboxymuconolactone decarboxylase family protein [Sphingomonas sp. ID1715]
MNERYLRGVEILQQLHGNVVEKVTNTVAEIAPDFARMTIEYPFGDLYARDGADLRTREIAAVSALAAVGAQPQLRIHVAAALHSGCTREELVEILMQVSIYAGFPAALNALASCHDLLAMPPDPVAAE